MFPRQKGRRTERIHQGHKIQVCSVREESRLASSLSLLPPHTVRVPAISERAEANLGDFGTDDLEPGRVRYPRGNNSPSTAVVSVALCVAN